MRSNRLRRGSLFVGTILVSAVLWIGTATAQNAHDLCLKETGDKAIAACDEAIKNDPKDFESFKNRGSAWYLKREFDKAFSDYDQAIKINPKYWNAYNNRGLIWHRKGAFDKAIADYDEAIRLNPRDARPYASRCLSWLAKGNKDKALADCNEAIRLDAKYFEAYYNLGQVWSARGNEDKAISNFDEAIRQQPKDVRYFSSRGSSWLAKGNLDKAVADYDEAIGLNPQYSPPYHNRGTARHRKGEYDKAIADYDEEIRLDPNYANAYYSRGLAYEMKKEYAAALADYRQASKVDPNDKNFPTSIARVSASIKAAPQAGTAPSSSPKRDDAANQAFKSFTTALEKLELYEKSKNADDWQAGLAAAQKATARQPQTADYWRVLGYAYALGGPRIELASALAEEAYEKSIGLDPKNTGSRMLLAAILIEREAYSRALTNIEAALNVKAELATSPVVADMCRIYIIDQQVKRGAAFLEAFADKNPKSHSARLGQAILLKELNRTEEAMKLAAKVADDPQAPQTDAEHAKALLKAWQG